MAIAGFGEIAEQLRRSTVLIHSGGRGSGSGVIWSSDGVIVTNAHVVHGSNVRVQLWDGREFDAAVASRDPRHDLAVLRIAAGSLPAVSPADSSQLRPGELAIAIGNHGLCWRAHHRSDPRHRSFARAWLPNLGASQCAARSRQFRRAAG